MSRFNANSLQFFEILCLISVLSHIFFRKNPLKAIALSGFFGSLLYHTKNYQGTTTTAFAAIGYKELYHTKNYQGTTTLNDSGDVDGILYYKEKRDEQLTNFRVCAQTYDVGKIDISKIWLKINCRTLTLPQAASNEMEQTFWSRCTQ